MFLVAGYSLGQVYQSLMNLNSEGCLFAVIAIVSGTLHGEKILMRLKRYKGKPSIELTSWQTHQWERAVRKARSEGTPKHRLPTRESFATLQRAT
jgi:hypothetical protein